MNIENIEAFVYVNHYGSFNKAADVLYLSQPSVTARIQTLERELNIKLFDRQGKQVTLTEKGKQFLPYAQQIINIFESGKEHIQEKAYVKQELRIGCTVSVANYVMPYILPFLNEQWPSLTYRITTTSSSILLDKLLAQEIDLAFVRHIVHPSIVSQKLYVDPITLYVYPEHPFATKKVVSIEEASKEQYIFFECGSLDWQRIHRIFNQNNYTLQVKYDVDNSETAKKLVVNQAGIAFLPSLSVKELVEEQRLVPIQVEDIDNVGLQTNLISLIGQAQHYSNKITSYNFSSIIPSKQIGISIN